MFQHLLVAIDGSDSSLAAAEIAIEMASLLHARLDMLSVEETPPRYISTQEEITHEHMAALTYFERLHAPLRRKAEQRKVQVQSSVRSGHEGQVILDYLAAEGCDLLVLGYQGHSGVWGAFLGSTADKVITHAPCSTITCAQVREGSVQEHPASLRWLTIKLASLTSGSSPGPAFGGTTPSPFRD